MPSLESVLPADEAPRLLRGDACLQERNLALLDDEQEWSPVVIRRKQFPSKRMTTRQAVDQMELVGHPFYLFVDAETDQCAVVYRRKGYDYGVISLDVT